MTFALCQECIHREIAYCESCKKNVTFGVALQLSTTSTCLELNSVPIMVPLFGKYIYSGKIIFDRKLTKSQPLEHRKFHYEKF